SNVLLESEHSYATTEMAGAAILETVQYGVLLENYVIDPPFSGPYRIFLQTPNGIIAHSPETFPDINSAEMAKKLIRDHIYRYYSLEGFYMVEHLLLDSNSVSNGLEVKDAMVQCQPTLSGRNNNYSFLIS